MPNESVANNSIIITASRRLARSLKTEHDKRQLALGHTAWCSPRVFFLDDWLASVVDTAVGTVPILLGSHASAVLWEQCLKRHTVGQLLNGSALVRQARQAWQRLNDWCVPIAEVSAAARSQDEQLFASAALDYQAILKERAWIDGAQLAGFVSDLVLGRIVTAPAQVVLTGFDRLVPAVERLFVVLAQNDCELSVEESNKRNAGVDVASFSDIECELRAAGAWARRELVDRPGASIAVIVPALEQNATMIERLVKEGVAPGWQYGGHELRTAVNVSYGRRLAEYPAIAVALLLLQWVYRGLKFDEVSVLLRTQFMASQQTAGRCRLELYLRRLPDQAWTPGAIVRLLGRRASDSDAAKWLEAVECLAAFQNVAGDRASPAGWADRIDGLLSALRWPASRTLASDEFQLLNRWRELLNDLARLEIVAPTMSFAEASRRLVALANETIYQPESRAAVVQLLGPLEAAGMQFDSIWVSGLDADTWPPAAHPLTLVSRQLQRRYSMPDSTPDDTLAYSRRVLERLVSSADRVRLSWPQSSEELDNSASPLIAKYAAVTGDQVADPGWHAIDLIGTHRIDQSPQDPVPAIRPGERVAGGAYTVQRHLTEPFASFAYGRLRVAELDSVAIGLSPAQRGSLVHAALHSLLAEKPTQHDMGAWVCSDLGQRISNAVDSSLKKYYWHADPLLLRVLALEHDRLHTLLEKFIREELNRMPFSVESVERELDYEHAGVRLNLRIDRIDRLSDDSLLIADYKTGQQKRLLNRHGDPHEFQLVVYACAIDGSIGGLLLINIDSRSIHYSGASASGEWDSKRADRWTERLSAWQERVARAIGQIAAGDVRINLSLPAEQTRALNILSRFQERVRA